MTDYVSNFDMQAGGASPHRVYVRDYTLGKTVERLKNTDCHPFLPGMLKGGTLLFIGDSYTTGTGASDHGGEEQNRFTTQLCRRLSATEINIGVGTTGFCDPGNGSTDRRFYNEWSRWYSSATTATRNSITAVFVCGGINDVGYGAAWMEVHNAAVDLLNDIHNKLPNALIVFVPMLWKGWNFTRIARNLYNGLLRAALDVTHPESVHTIQWAFTWNFFRNCYQAENANHPNDNGYMRIAKGILKGLTDPSGAAADTWEQVSYVHVNAGLENFIFRENGIVRSMARHIYLDQTVPAGTSLNIGTVTEDMTPFNNEYAPIFYGAEVVGSLSVTENGRVNVNVSPDATGGISQFYVPTMEWFLYGKQWGA